MIRFLLRMTLSIAIAMVALVSCVSETDGNNQAVVVEPMSANETAMIENFEKNFLQGENNKQTRASQGGLHLYGYVTVVYHGEDSAFVNNLWAYYKSEIDSMGHFLVLDGKVRVYFPLSDAIAKLNLSTLYSDSLGCIANYQPTNPMSIKITGRTKTEQSVYTRFAQPYTPEKSYQTERALIFNLGERDFCCSKKSIKRLKVRSENSTDGRVSCMQNHGGVNCTVAFGHRSGNCVTKYDRCMDYNGKGSDCSGSHLYFVGSDCSRAMAHGHCWNEVMN